MPRIRLDLAYDGSGFSGWAAQPGRRTVQGVLTEALATLLREDVQLTVAGRTDAGVHAAGQVAHLDVSDEAWAALPGRSDRTSEQALLDRLDGLLIRGSGVLRASDVVVRAVRVVDESFDARFAAIWRAYRYRVAEPDAFDPRTRASTWWVRDELDVAAMGEAAALLVGEWDFAALCKPREGASTIRRLTHAEVMRADGAIAIDLRADAFCHSMVRSIVGCLVAVGQGKKPASWLGEVLASRDRSLAAAVAPAHGLTLMAVGYPPQDQWASRQEETRRFRTTAAGRDES